MSYGCLLLDPPWAEYGGGGRGAQQHYSLMSKSEIAKTILRSGVWEPAPSSHLWCWVTDNHLLDGLALIEELGFRYIRTFCWVKSDNGKIQIGLGQYARGAHELCLFAAHGEPVVPATDKRPPSVILSPRREHSRKPEQCYHQWYEAISTGPRLEMFSRNQRPGWDCFGNETTKFVPQPAVQGNP
jgi:N6-adenosine-specific RNA methylase IME4